jgi:hypothetical protein
VEFFSNWGMELLVTQLHDHSKAVSMEALDILDEACEDKVGEGLVGEGLVGEGLVGEGWLWAEGWGMEERGVWSGCYILLFLTAP